MKANPFLQKRRAYGQKEVPRYPIAKVDTILEANPDASKEELLAAIKGELTPNTQLGSDVKAEYLYYQQFPYAKSSRASELSDDVFARIALNSSGKNVSYHAKLDVVVRWMLLILVVCSLAIQVGMLTNILKNPKTMSTRTDVPKAQIDRRQKDRGYVAKIGRAHV